MNAQADALVVDMGCARPSGKAHGPFDSDTTAKAKAGDQHRPPRHKRPPDRLGYTEQGNMDMKYTILAVLLAASFAAGATKTNEGCQGNCPSTGGGPTSSESNAVGVGLGVGLGVGIGGDSSANVGDIKNTATGGAGGSALSVSEGGKGGDGGSGYGFGGDAKAYGGNASQGQQQGQSSRNDNTNVSGSKSVAQMASENTNRVNASSANDNRSSAAGNTTVTNVGGDSTLVERNAPPVFLGNLSATMSCSGGFNAGASDRNGSGAFGFTWISGDCRSVVIGREFVGIGMPDVACRVWKTTKGYKRAVKADPSLADVDCSIKPEPAAVVAPAPVLVAPELAPRIPRG